jgi:hypothetical protein
MMFGRFDVSGQLSIKWGLLYLKQINFIYLDINFVYEVFV